MARQGYPLQRLDRWLGKMLARAAGTVALVGGAGAAWSVLTLADFSFGEYWPVLAIAAALLGVAVVCFRSRPSFLDMMSEVPLSRGEAAARRRDVAVDVDDERRG